MVTSNSKLIPAIRKLAEQYPDFIYEKGMTYGGCSYNVGGCDKYPELKGCIVGQALRSIGCNDLPDTGTSVLVCRGLGVHLSEDEGNWVRNVQKHQDKGYRWDAAVAFADREGKVNELIEGVKRLAKQYPDFVYEQPNAQGGCSNIDGGCDKYPNKGCIIGQAIRSLGVSLHSGNSKSGVPTLIQQQQWVSNDKQMGFLVSCQNLQDSGKPWIQCIS